MNTTNGKIAPSDMDHVKDEVIAALREELAAKDGQLADKDRELAALREEMAALREEMVANRCAHEILDCLEAAAEESRRKHMMKLPTSCARQYADAF